MTVATVRKNCAACGALITVRIADHKRGWGKFCNKACAAAHKCGQRPGDVNKTHAKYSKWAADTYATRLDSPELFTKAPKIKEQIGHKINVKPVYHSPAHCHDCGEPINGPGLCQSCEDHHYALDAAEAGWDGHKGYFK